MIYIYNNSLFSYDQVFSSFLRKMSEEKSRNISEMSKRISQWEELMRKFSQARKEDCTAFLLDIPRVQRSEKRFPTGSEYEGTWDMLGMSGFGVYKFPNGAIYEGEFEDGMFHGEGLLMYPSGVTLETKWRRGELVHRTLIFADGLEYAGPDYTYCKMPDRRFTIEYHKGLQPAGQSFLTAEQPTLEIPSGYFDVGDGFYSSKTKVVYKYDDLNTVIRAPTDREQQWIVQNCRLAPMTPLGPQRNLYEKWMEPSVTLPKVPRYKGSVDPLELQVSDGDDISWGRHRQSSKYQNASIRFQSNS